MKNSSINPGTVLDNVRYVDGWLGRYESILLFQLARACGPGNVIVEIGSYKGKSTICLGHGSKRGNAVKIYAIDPHTGSSEHRAKQKEVWTFDEFSKNIQTEGLEDLVKPILKFSTNAIGDVSEPIGLLFIDGAHEYEAILRDFTLWHAKVAPGGWIAFHDTIWWKNVYQVVREKILFSNEFADFSFVESITFARRTSQKSGLQNIRSRYIALLLKLYYWLRVRNKIHRRIPYRAMAALEKLFFDLQGFSLT